MILYVIITFVAILIGMAISVSAFGTGGKRKKIFQDIYFSIEDVDGIGVLYTKTGEFSAVLKMENPVQKHSANIDAYYDFTHLFTALAQTLGEGYVQQGTHCKNTAHNHLSPDGVVDASVGLLPDYTFYFKGQDHEKTGSNDVIMKLATELLTNHEFKDVYSMPDRFPQFNIGRNTKDLVNNLMKPAQEIDRSTLSAEDAAELDAALEECNAMLENTVVDPAATEHAQKRLENILIKIGEREAPNENKEKLSAVGEAISKFISDALYECVGAQGYSDAVKQLLELIGKYFPQPA